LPHSYGAIKNDVKIVSGKKRSVYTESLGIKDGKETFRVFGEIGRDARSMVLYNSVEDPSGHIAAVFAAMLKREGLKLGKDYAGLTPSKASGTVIAELESLPILEQIRLANTYSNNFMAEQIFRMIGAKKFAAPATVDKGRKATEEFLAKIPECGLGMKVPNGSGLSWEGRVSSLCFVKLLQRSYHEFRGFADMIGSMPVGNSTGTLKARFAGFGSWFDPWKVRAKTGTLWSKGAVTSLIGFVPSQSGDLFVFSVILNHKTKGDAPIPSMRAWEEQNVAFLQKLDVVP
jgi:D-alanyl-D-alanine carboxypeptidase/D-alanyl-D-alanine-endopeptidase (penicillin-binding protein 4)